MDTADVQRGFSEKYAKIGLRENKAARVQLNNNKNKKKGLKNSTIVANKK